MTTTRPTPLTSHQRSVYYRLVREAAIRCDLGRQAPLFTAKILARHFDSLHGRQVYAVGNGGALNRLRMKERLVVVVDDETTPIYALAPGWERDVNRARAEARPVPDSPAARRLVLTPEGYTFH